LLRFSRRILRRAGRVRREETRTGATATWGTRIALVKLLQNLLGR